MKRFIFCVLALLAVTQVASATGVAVVRTRVFSAAVVTPFVSTVAVPVVSQAVIATPPVVQVDDPCGSSVQAQVRVRSVNAFATPIFAQPVFSAAVVTPFFGFSTFNTFGFNSAVAVNVQRNVVVQKARVQKARVVKSKTVVRTRVR